MASKRFCTVYFVQAESQPYLTGQLRCYTKQIINKTNNSPSFVRYIYIYIYIYIHIYIYIYIYKHVTKKSSSRMRLIQYKNTVNKFDNNMRRSIRMIPHRKTVCTIFKGHHHHTTRLINIKKHTKENEIITNE